MDNSKVNESLLSRITEVNKEKLDPLPPIKRWLRNTQVTSIEEATNGIPIPFIEDEVETAKNYAIRKKKELTETNLTVDEIAALILYTSEWPKSSGENQSLYFQLNKWLRESDRSAAVPFFKYLVLLLSGLSKIPPCDGIMLYRGVRQDLRALYQSKKDKNMTVIWNGLSSSTIKLGVLQDFLGNSGQGTMFHIHSKTARKISDFSVFQKEEEALFFPLSQFDIDSLFVHGDLTIVSLREVDPIESLTSLFSNVTLVQSPSPIRGVGTGILPLSSPSPSKSDVGTGIIPLTKNKNVEKDEDVSALHEKWTSLINGDSNRLVGETTIHFKGWCVLETHGGRKIMNDAIKQNMDANFRFTEDGKITGEGKNYGYSDEWIIQGTYDHKTSEATWRKHFSSGSYEGRIVEYSGHVTLNGTIVAIDGDICVLQKQKLTPSPDKVGDRGKFHIVGKIQ